MSLGGSPITILSHHQRRNARVGRTPARVALRAVGAVSVDQFRTKRRMLVVSAPRVPTLEILAGIFADIGRHLRNPGPPLSDWRLTRREDSMAHWSVGKRWDAKAGSIVRA